MNARARPYAPIGGGPLKANILQVGTVSEDGVVSGWIFDAGHCSGLVSAFDLSDEFNPKTAGWSVGELRALANMPEALPS